METNQTNRDNLEAELHSIGVHDGFPDHRRAMAVALEVHGITVEDLTILADGVAAQRRRDSDAVPAIVAKLLGDPKAAAARIGDMRRGRERRQAQEAPGSQYPGASVWKRGIDWTEADRVRDRRVAYAILRVDRKPASEAAAFLGCSEQEAERLAEEHAEDRKAWRNKEFGSIEKTGEKNKG